LKAKVFGGAAVLELKHDTGNIGLKNSSFVLEFLATENIPVVVQRLGGLNPLEVRFFTHSARVLLRTIQRDCTERVATAELLYRNQLETVVRNQTESDITLF
jgi:chemotaxis protein CheD